MNEITTVGVDLAKEVIVVCAADAQGRTRYFKQLSFSGFGEWAMNLPSCTFGLEACSTAHYWARFLSAHGHTPKLMAAEFVAPFRKSQGAKNDKNDAQAILVAVRQPDMRFVSVKSVDQQAMLAWHRARSWLRARAYGIVEPHPRVAGRVRCLARPLFLRIDPSAPHPCAG